MSLKLFPFVISGLLLSLILMCAGCTQDQANIPYQTPVTTAAVTSLGPSSPTGTRMALHAATREEMVAFVKEAVAYARQNGKEKALEEINNRNGSFFRGELYLYAYDMNGTTIAHPVNPEKIGVNRLNEKDAEGNLFIEDLRQAAINETGFVTYYYINPTHNNAVEKKLGYAMTVDPTWWLGSGIYQGPADVQLGPAIDATLRASVATTPLEK
jgi:signal transduction histidine kinase